MPFASRPHRPFRFGFQARNAESASAWRDLARKTEDLGYSTLTLPDHFEDAWNPLVPLTVALESTTTLRVGALVLANDYRHPALLAREAAALDFLSEGRFELGMGAGWMTADYVATGIALDPPGVRITRLEEALTLMKAMWAEGSATFEGTHYQVAGVACHPRPYTAGGPPLTIGGGGRRVLGIAARHADVIGVNIELTAGVASSPEAARAAVADRFRERIGWIRQAAGDRFDTLELQLLGQIEVITDDRDTLLEQAAPMFGVTAAEARSIPVALVGTPEQIADDLVQRREEYGFSYVVVHDVDAFAPVVARLAGT